MYNHDSEHQLANFVAEGGSVAVEKQPKTLGALERVYSLMKDGMARTPAIITEQIGVPNPAHQLRDLRRGRYRGVKYQVSKTKLAHNVFAYSIQGSVNA